MFIIVRPPELMLNDDQLLKHWLRPPQFLKCPVVRLLRRKDVIDKLTLRMMS